MFLIFKVTYIYNSYSATDEYSSKDIAPVMFIIHDSR